MMLMPEQGAQLASLTGPGMGGFGAAGMRVRLAQAQQQCQNGNAQACAQVQTLQAALDKSQQAATMGSESTRVEPEDDTAVDPYWGPRRGGAAERRGYRRSSGMAIPSTSFGP